MSTHLETESDTGQPAGGPELARGSQDTMDTGEDPEQDASIEGADGDELLPTKSSQPLLLKRDTRTKADREAAKGQKPGSKGNFTGESYEFLRSHLREYNLLDRSSEGKNTRLAAFWHKINAGIWERLTLEEGRTITDVGPEASEADITVEMQEVSDNVCDREKRLTEGPGPEELVSLEV